MDKSVRLRSSAVATLEEVEIAFKIPTELEAV
jgi:hypothetical protein